MNEKNWFIFISLTFVHESGIYMTAGLVPVMAFRRTVDESLPEQMKTQFIDTYVRHLDPVNEES